MATIGVAPQLFHNTRTNLLASVSVCGGHSRCDWRRRQMIQHEFVYPW